MTMTFIEDPNDTPKRILNVSDLGYLGAQKDYIEQLSSIPYRKKRTPEISK